MHFICVKLCILYVGVLLNLVEWVQSLSAEEIFTDRASRLQQMDAAFSFYDASDPDNREGITPPPVTLQHHRISSENKTPFSHRAWPEYEVTLVGVESLFSDGYHYSFATEEVSSGGGE